MQIGMSGAAAGNGKGKANQFTAVERTNDLAADLLADHKHAQRHQIHIVKIPDFFLQRDAGIEFFHAVTFSDCDLIRSQKVGAHDLGPSSVLACCHKASISSRLASSSVRPWCRNCSSSQPKRRLNFLLVLRNADSPSTER